MTFDTREQARIRRALDAVLDHVEPAPDLDYLIERASVVRADAPSLLGDGSLRSQAPWRSLRWL